MQHSNAGRFGIGKFPVHNGTQKNQQKNQCQQQAKGNQKQQSFHRNDSWLKVRTLGPRPA